MSNETPSQTFEMGDKPPEILPFGYQKNDIGIFKVITKETTKGNIEIIIPLCNTAFNITKKLTNPDTNEVFYEISFDNKTVIISGSDISSKKGMLLLAGYGIITSEGKAKELCNFLMEYRALNAIPEVLVYDRFGWKDDGSFVLGEQRITKDGVTKCMLAINGKEAKAIKSSGTIEGWVNAVSGLMKYDTQRFKIYNGVKAPLLKILGGSNHILNDSGGTSVGKTITCLCTTSMFGNPVEMMLGGTSTNVGMEMLAYQFCDMPIHIDDTHKIEEEVLNRVVYQLGNGTGKLRGAKNGGLQDTPRWRTIGLFTGEAPIIKDDSYDGMDMRMIELKRGLGATDVDAVHTFNEGTKENYGVFAPILINWIIKNPNKIIELNKESIKTIAGAVPGDKALNQNVVAIADRLTDTFAPILTAGKIFEYLYKTIGGDYKDPEPIVKDAFKKALFDRSGENLALRGAKRIMSWIASNKMYFLEDGMKSADKEGHPRQYRILGNIKTNEYVLIPSELKKELLKITDFSIGRLMDDFKQEGLLKTDPDRPHHCTRKIDGTGVKAYVLKRPEFDKFADVEEEK